MAVTISVSVTQNSQNIAGNTSNVTVKATVKWTGGSYNATGECYGSITIDGTKYSFSELKFNTGKTTSGSQTIMTKTVDVKHNSDGTKKLKYLTEFYTGVSSGTIEASAYTELKSIPRKSTLTVSTPRTLGTGLTLTVDKKSSNFTHTITYSCGNASGTICTKSSSTSVAFTPPLSLASQNTTGSSVSISFITETFSGSTSLGTVTYSMAFSIPSSVKPSCKISVSDAEGYPVYIALLSKLKITVTPSLAYGSPIVSYSVKANGATYTTASVTTSVLLSPGTVTITATVTDKRGRTGTASATVSVYEMPTLSVSNGTLGVSQKLTITRGNPKFTHTLSYACMSVSGSIEIPSSDNTDIIVPFTPPLELAKQNTAGTSVYINFTLTTYYEGKKISSHIITMKCSIPESVKPSVSINYTDPTGNALKYGGMVKSISQLLVQLETSTSYDSKIVSYSTTIKNNRYTTDVIEYGAITSTENIVIEATVTDERGRKGTAKATISGIIDYFVPNISLFNVRRCSSTGVADDKGDHAQIIYSANIAPLNNLNTASYTVRYKKSKDTDFIQGETFSGVYSFSNRSFIFPADKGFSYDVVIVATDSHSSEVRKTSVSTGFVLMHFGSDGNSIGFGKIAEVLDGIDIGLDVMFRNEVRGNAVGLSGLIPIPSSSNLNNYVETGGYAIHSNSTAETIANCPYPVAGRLFVSSSIGNTPDTTGWGYIRQTFIPYNLSYPMTERDITRDNNNVWSYGEWIKTYTSKNKPSPSEIGAAPAGNYMKVYPLNSIDIDNTPDCWTTDVSIPGYGTYPLGDISAWYNVTQTTSGHFEVQIAIRCVGSLDSSRSSSMWYRDRYTGIVPETTSYGIWSQWKSV